MGRLYLPPATLRTIEVVLDGDHHSETAKPVHRYTTYDDIRGHVAITAAIPTPFSCVEISLLGTVRTTHADHIAPVIAAPGAQHVFLKLTMPLPPSAYPTTSSDSDTDTYHLTPGQPLRIPFHFVVPAHLLPVACKHDYESPAIQDAHLCPPPSLGGFLLPRDDLAPEMATVTYGVHAKLLSIPPCSSGYPQSLVSTLRKVHVTPASPESPPLPVGTPSRYVLSRAKSLRRGVFKGKLGTFTLSTTQPRAFRLPPPPTTPHAQTTPPSTLTALTLRFDPTDASCVPPRLGALTAKIRATTVHSIRPHRGIPDEETRSSPYEIHSGSYSTHVSLASHEVTPAAAPWTYHIPAPAYERRDSGYSTAESDDEVESAGGASKGGYYTATIPLPLTLPANKTWVPTFHSCLVSRFYTLMIELMVHPTGKSAVPRGVALKVPVQILGEGREGREEAFEAEGRAVVEGARGGWEDEGRGDGEGGSEGGGEGVELGDVLPGYVAPGLRVRRS